MSTDCLVIIPPTVSCAHAVSIRTKQQAFDLPLLFNLPSCLQKLKPVCSVIMKHHNGVITMIMSEIQKWQKSIAASERKVQKCRDAK